jgi:predicted DNA-binding protein
MKKMYSFRLADTQVETLRNIAEGQARSLTNLVDVIFREYISRMCPDSNLAAQNEPVTQESQP